MNEFEGVVLREKERSLHISRVPKKVKEEFVELAREEFAEDYGMALRELLEKYKEYGMIINNFDIKLNYIIQILEQSTATQEEKPDRKMLSGELKGGDENGST